MNQTDSEQQLQIWKDLAISKQMLMNEAASLLKLNAEWTQEELKDALDEAIKRGNEAEKLVAEAREQAANEISEMQAKMEAADKARNSAEAAVAVAKEAQETAERQLANGRKENAEALKKYKQQVADKDKELKAINSALADTPANVLKKLKNLKRQKLEEAQARTRAEEANRKLKKTNKEQSDELETLNGMKEKAQELVAAYNSLVAHAEEQQSALKEAGVDVKSLPEIDPMLLGSFGSSETEEQETETREAAHA